MNRKQRRAAERDKLNIGPAINGDQGEALTDLVSQFLEQNLGFAQPFALLVTNGHAINVLGNAGPEVLASMLEIVHTQPKVNVEPGALSGEVAGSA